MLDSKPTRSGSFVENSSSSMSVRRNQRVLGFLLATTVSTGAMADGRNVVSAEIIWPLSRTSGDELLLNLPPGYAGRQLYEDAAKRGPDARATDLPVEDDLLLMARWPNLDPTANYDSSYWPHGAFMQTLLQARALGSYRGQTINTLENAFDNAVAMSTQSLCRAGSGAKGGCNGPKEGDVKPAKFGLQRLGVDFNQHPEVPAAAWQDMSQRDIYYLRDDGGTLRTVIFCTAEEAKTVDDEPQGHGVAQCEHKFIDEKLNALVSIHYRRVYLQDWREVEAAWRKLLESFIELRVTNPRP